MRKISQRLAGKPDAIHRFWNRVFKYSDKPNACWLWAGALNTAKYGQIRIDGKNIAAHRFSYEIHKGPIPSEMDILHSCDTPWCCNPDHLSTGTRSQNMQDMIRKNRCTNAKLTFAEARAIKTSAEHPKVLAKKYGVSKWLIQMIQGGGAWRTA